MRGWLMCFSYLANKSTSDISGITTASRSSVRRRKSYGRINTAWYREVCNLNALTPAQQTLVTQNLGLVSHVIETCVSLPYNQSVYDYDDLYQIGCMGLCKAAATTTGKGKFSTYACKVIRNEIYNALIYAARRTHLMYIEAMQERGTENMDDTASSQAILESLERSKQGADTMVCKGIEAIVQSARGVPRPDIARSIGVSVNSLRAYISVARKHLKQNQQFQREIA